MATMQDLIEQWKKEAAQSQTVTGPEIPNIAMYQAQNDVHRDYGAANSALAREVANQQMLAQPVIQMAPTGLDVTMQEKQDLVNARREAEALQAAKSIPSGTGIGSSLQMLPSMADYQSNAVSNRDGVLKYIADHPDEAEYVTRFLELNNGEMDGIKYKNYLKQQKDYELAQKWVDPNYKMSKEEEKYGEKLALDRYKVLSSKKNRTPEEDAELRTMDDLFMKTDEFSSFILNSADEAVKAVRGVKWLTDHGFMGPVQMLANKITDPISNKLLGAYDEVDKTPIQNAQTQNPIASGAGRFATNAALYSATNPAFDAIAEASGLTGAGKFALNQAAQFGQDVALDTIPTYVDMAKDGSLSDEEKKELAKGALLNAGGNLVLGGLGEAFKGANRADIPEVDKTIKEATEQAENAQKRIQELARQNEEVLPALGDMTKGAEDIPYTVTKAEPEIPKMETPKAEIAQNVQKTASKAEIEELNNELSNMWVDNAAKETKSAAKTQRLDLPEEVTEKGASDFQEIYDSLESMRQVAEKSGNEKVVDKFNKLSKAVSDYENAFFKEESEETLTSAKKAADAARQSFIREVKKTNPNYTGELTGTKLGNAAYRRTSMKAAEEANQELADSITEADNMLNTNRWAKDAASETQVPFKGPKEDAGFLQTFGGEAEDIPGMKVSETYTNTGKRGGGWTEAEYEAHTNPNNYLYETIDEAQSVERATQMRNTEGREAFKNRALYSDRLSSVELDGLMMEWRQLTEEARALEAAGKRADTKWLESNKIFRKIQEQSTNNAQALQALAKWSRNTPEGMLVNAENIINGKAKANKGELQKAIDKLLKTNKGGVEFSPEFERDFIKTATPLMDLKGTELDGREAREIMAKLGKMVNEQIPVKWPEKLTTILMDNMLGNFRTLITRNAGGNVGLNAVEQLVQRPLAAGIDTLVSAKTGKRTQAGLSAAGLKEYVEGFTKGIADEAADLKTGLRTARSGENTLENAIKNNRRVFKTKVANGLDGLVKSGLSVGDRPFYEGVYKQTLGDYQRLRDRGVLGDAIQGLSDQDFKLYSETAAKLNALGAVYQQDTVLSKALLEFKQAVGDLSRGTIGVDILSQFSMPFVKTPANVIERAIDYSPLGLVRNTFRTGKELSQGAFDQNRFANETARNILGTALMGGGAAMAANGALSGKYSENKNEKQAQKESGMQEYAWNVPEEIPGIGGKQMDISWAPVVGSNLVAAAAAYDAYKNGKDDLVNNLAAGATAGGQALFNQSMFQGLQRLFGTGESYNSDEGIVANMGNVVKSGLGQFIPSLVRQAAQVKDPYQRDLAYSNKGTTFGPFEAYDINSLANNIPGLREDYLAPKVNSQGELMKENQGRSIPMKILEDMILPGKLTEVTSNRLNEEAKRLSEITTNASAYMPKADRQYVDTEEHTLTNDEWTEYRQRYGKEMTSAGEKLLDSEFYKASEDAEKEKLLKDVYSDVRSAINSEYTGKEVTGASKAYVEAGGGEKGVDAVISYYAGKDIIEEAGLSSSSNAAKEIKEAANSGDMEKAQKIADNAAKTKEILDKYDISTSSNAGKDIKAAIEAGKPREAEMIAKKAKEVKVEEAKQKETQETLSDYGLKKTSSAKTYEKAKSEIPGLTTQQFATTYKAIDSDHNEGIKQDEIIDYLNSNNVSEADAQKIWSAYGNKTWKAIPVLKNGKWSKGKR